MTEPDISPPPAANSSRAYRADWKHFTAWCRRENEDPMRPEPQLIARYLQACAGGSPAAGGRPASWATIRRRLPALAHNLAARGLELERQHPIITETLTRLRGTAVSTSPAAFTPAEIRALLASCDRSSLRGLRDNAVLLLGLTSGWRRAALAGLDLGPGQSPDATGWIALKPDGLTLCQPDTELHLPRSSTAALCVSNAVESWLKFARISRGPLFRRVTGQGQETGENRLNDREITRIVKRAVLQSGIRGTLPEAERLAQFSASSLRKSALEQPH